ncbi:DNA polymerase III subunit alpha [Virgibacillus soli]|uniref:DNA polymerase III subunit alpha n=2 Tax=Paracerasibacillus soli TaxID=480284 RepID=UPI0035EA8FE5
MSFTHLQVKSGYSLMESTVTVEKLVLKAKELKLTALALTDEHVLHGVVPFYQTCIKNGIKPIVGMTVHVLTEPEQVDTCILLAKNNQGYHDLIRLSTFLNTNESSVISLDALANYVGDVFGILPAIQSKLGTIGLQTRMEQAEKYVTSWKNTFKKNSLFIGIQDHGLEEERVVNQFLQVLQQKASFQVVAINDVRYLEERDVLAYDCLQAMKQGRRWTNDKSPHALKRFHHLRSTTEMEQIFTSSWPEALQMTEVIRSQCNVDLSFHERKLPTYPLPQDVDSANMYLRQLCYENVKKKYVQMTDTIRDRLDYELSIIQTMKFSDYFLIVWDFIKYAKEKEIIVGPGRGSSAGSLVAYVLNITEIDPLKHDLLFERFLNPERVTMPDIDVDFPDHRRDEVIQYVQNKYGKEHVAQIITFGTFLARSLLRELIKTIGINQQDTNFIMQHIPAQTKQPLQQIVRENKVLHDYIRQSEKLTLLFAIAIKLEGLPRHVSTHAAGIVISEQPLQAHVPLMNSSTNIYLTQYAMNQLETIGLLKFDFLGLRNLTLLERMIRTANEVLNRKISLAKIPENDGETFSLLQNGKTNGVFQLESVGMKRVLTRLKPTEFVDIVAVNALYRPGPMDNIPLYINRKYGLEEVTYPHPDLKPILESTYGVLIYQEQIMQIAHRIAGFTLGQADILRRAVSKKKQDVMAAQKEAFIQGCIRNGYNKSVSEELFAWIVKFSNYGFPKSHAVAYSKISYELAYLKAHYPLAFYAELLSSVSNQPDKTSAYIKEMRAVDIHLAPPSINDSFHKYTVEGNGIRMGLLAIKGVGVQAVTEIVHVRKTGPFTSLFDFCLRVSTKAINRATLETLIIAGVFDDIYPNRASLLASIDQAMEQGELFKEFLDQPSFFQDELQVNESYVPIEDFTLFKKLADEKELLGMYVSDHPLQMYRRQLKKNGFISIQEAEQNIGRFRKGAVTIQAIKKIRTKRGDSMAFLVISDESNEMDAVLFPNIYREVSTWLQEEQIVVINGKVDMRNDRLQWVISEIGPFEEEAFKESNQRLFVKITNNTEENAMSFLKAKAKEFPGQTPILIYHEEKKQTYKLTHDFIQPNEECISQLQQYFGNENVVLNA